MYFKRVYIAALLCILNLTGYGAVVGTIAPPLNVKKVYNSSSKKVSLPDFRGKAVLISFWSAWGNISKSIMPRLVKIHEKFSDDGLVIIAQTDRSSHGIRGYIKDNGLKFIITEGKERLWKSYEMSTTPHAFLLDDKGVVIWQGKPFKLSDSTIKATLEKLHPMEKGYPTFEKNDELPSKIAKIHKSISKGAVGRNLKKFDNMLARETSAEKRIFIEESRTVIYDWIEEVEQQIDDDVEVGDGYRAHKAITFLSKALKGHPKEKPLRKRAKEIAASDAYKIGKTYLMLEKKLVKADRETQKKTYAAFAQKYPNSYYAELAEKF